MLSFAHRLSAVVLTLALTAGQAAVCAGWMPSPEARMFCCSDGVPCPMHKSDPEREATPHVVTQAEGDSCCAASEPDHSSPSPSSIAFVTTLGAVVSPVPAPLPEPASHHALSRVSPRIPAARVPKHLLLSVLIV